MSFKLTRIELYNKVWSYPLTKLAAELGISDSRLGKICKTSGIPRPGAGYWAKKAAGKNTIQVSLPPRFPGSKEHIKIGQENRCNPNRREEILNAPLPPPPNFDEELDEVKLRITEMIKTVPIPSLKSKCHPVISRLLAHEEERRKEIEGSSYTYSWNKLIFDTPIQQRRLRILNAIFLASQQLGCRTIMSTSKYDEDTHIPDIKIGDTSIGVYLNVITHNNTNSKKHKNDCLHLSFERNSEKNINTLSWMDTDSGNIENNLLQIVRGLLFTGECQYRHREEYQYQWLVERKAEYEEEERQHILDEERKVRELQEKTKQERIDNLIAQATSLQKAQTIRAYVDAIQNTSEIINTPNADIDKWSKWALEQADNLDPIKQLSFLEPISN